MNILITGGTGLIGSALIERWQVKKQNNIILLTRNKSKASKKFPGLTIIESLADADFNRLDAIVNLAGEPIFDKAWTTKQKSKLCQSRWDLTAKLVDGINARNKALPKLRFISGSAVGYYGASDESPLTETSGPQTDDFPHQLCQRWEAIALQADANTAVIRTGIVLSDKGGALSQMALPFKFGLGAILGSGNQMMPWIHLEDELNAIEFLLANPSLIGPFNLTAPVPVTHRIFCKTLANALNRPCLFRAPAFVLKALLGERATLLLDGQAAIPSRLQEHGFEFRYPALTTALASLYSE